MKLRHVLFVVAATFLLQGCGAHRFDPPIYQLADNKVADLPVAGKVEVINASTATAPAEIYSYAGTSLESDYKTITATMVQQVQDELAKHGTVKKGQNKTIRLNVTQLRSQYSGFYVFNGSMTFTVALGTAKPFEMSIKHRSGSVHQDLSGSIADGVVALMKDERVLAYLAK